jgi:hypothetical protein
MDEILNVGGGGGMGATVKDHGLVRASKILRTVSHMLGKHIRESALCWRYSELEKSWRSTHVCEVAEGKETRECVKWLKGTTHVCEVVEGNEA